jgi:transposase
MLLLEVRRQPRLPRFWTSLFAQCLSGWLDIVRVAMMLYAMVRAVAGRGRLQPRSCAGSMRPSRRVILSYTNSRFCLWTLAIIRTLLEREHGIELSKSGVSRLLRHLGLSPQRPIYRSYKQDPKKLQKYLKRTFPELQDLAKRTGAVIYFIDEASVRSDAHRETTWGKIGETPVVVDSGDRFGLRLAVSPRGDMKFATFEGRMTGPRFVQFLKDLRSDTGGPIIVIVDNARYHRSGPVKQFVEANDADVVIEHLPCYAPEYNPDEQVWNHAKARLAKLFITTKDELFREMRAIMRSIQRSPELIRSFFQLDHTRYAADAL